MKILKVNKQRKSVTKYLLSLCTMLFLSLAIFDVTAFAAGEPTMDSSWGFSSGNSLAIKSRYWQYGPMDWTSAILYAQNNFANSPANVSVRFNDSNAYNDCGIRVSSNYWSQFDWWGTTSKESSNVYVIQLNSTKIQSDVSSSSLDWYTKKVTVHELGHAFGLDHATSPDYVMCQGFVNVNSLTSYENQLFVNRYGRY